MRIGMISFMLLLSVPLVAGTAFPFAKADQECSTCHTLSNEQARSILNDVIPNVKVLHVQQGPITGLWEVGVDLGGRKGIIYLDYAKKKIISPLTRGEVIDIRTRQNLTQESFLKISRVDVASIPVKDALLFGDRNAKHKIIVFDDPD